MKNRAKKTFCFTQFPEKRADFFFQRTVQHTDMWWLVEVQTFKFLCISTCITHTPSYRAEYTFGFWHCKETIWQLKYEKNDFYLYAIIWCYIVC